MEFRCRGWTLACVMSGARLSEAHWPPGVPLVAIPYGPPNADPLLGSYAVCLPTALRRAWDLLHVDPADADPEPHYRTLARLATRHGLPTLVLLSTCADRTGGAFDAAVSTLLLRGR